MSMTPKTIAELRDPEYRKAFVASQINVGLPFQIRGLLKSKGWTQDELAHRTGMLQPRISALLTPGKVRPNIETLRRIADAFDCGLEVRFVPFGELVHRSESFDPDNFNVPTFDEEIRQAEEREDALVAALTANEITSTTFVTEGVLDYSGQPPHAFASARSGVVPVLYDTSESRGVELVYQALQNTHPPNLRRSLLPPQWAQQERTD